MSDIKKLHIDELKKRFESYDTISVDDFNDFYKDCLWRNKEKYCKLAHI